MNIILALALAAAPLVQMPDTTGIYGERQDSLQATVKIAHQSSMPKGKDIRAEVITAAGLCKMACCNLAESFENSASVTVGYSDAVTGARQIRLLGQSGIYTQMLDENRPVMRGLSAPFGLNYVPGQWLESIQISKGVASVINGVESMTGQINMEHRKPTDEKPLYVQASVMNDTKTDLNVVSALQFDEMQTWSTVLMGHIDGNFKTMDMNGDGFADDPQQLNIALSNRWLYFGQDGTQVRFGVRAIQDHRLGGQMEELGAGRWMADIANRSLGTYVKAGTPLNEDGSQNIALVADYTFQKLGGEFGNRLVMDDVSFYGYDANQHSAFLNLLYMNESDESHKFTLGASDMLDIYHETFGGPIDRTILNDAGVFGEYTYHNEDIFSAITGLRADWYAGAGVRVSPRVTLKYAPSEKWVFRANGGRGIRYSTPVIDNIGVFSTGKSIDGNLTSHPLEDAWTVGGNISWYPFGGSSTYLSLDYFGTRFVEQMLVENSANRIGFYTLSSMGKDAKSYTHNLQFDFYTEPFEGMQVTATFRYTDPRQTLSGQGSDIKPMTSLYKGVLNLQYATALNKWIFDFTASANGPVRVWDFMKDLEFDGVKPYASGYTPVYPLLYAQVTRRFRGFDLYVGGENLTNYTQPNPIIGADNPFSSSFDASCVWGPLMGARIYGGVRITIWKTE